jgi:transcriptional regulator with XRE-family HTH domain
MQTRIYTFRELLEAAAKPMRHLWNADGALNLNAVSRFYESCGARVSQATLWRLFSGQHARPSDDTIEATEKAFGIPRALLRGEQPGELMSRMIEQFGVRAVFLANRIEQAELDQTEYDAVIKLLETFEAARAAKAKVTNPEPKATKR